MKLGVSQSLVQSDTGQNYYMSRARCPSPRLPFHRLCLQDARAGQPHAGSHAVPRGRAAAAGWRGSGLVAPPGRYGGGSGGEAAVVVAVAGEGQGTCGQCTRWRVSCSTCSGRLPVIMQRQGSAVLYRVSLTSGWCLSSSSSTEFFLVVNRDRYPQLRFSQPGSRVLQYIDKVVDVPGDAVALWRLVKEFHILLTCCSRCSLGIWTSFP